MQRLKFLVINPTIQNIVFKSFGKLINASTFLAPSIIKRYGLKIFSAPKQVKLSDVKLQFLNTAENIDLVVDDINVRLYKWGSGSKVVLFCHGWQSNSHRWKKYIVELQKKDYTIYSVDAPASGQSAGKYLNAILYREVILNVIEHVGKIDFFVGHSLGAFSLFYTFFNEPTLKPLGFVALATPGNAMDFVKTFKKQLGLNERTFNLIVDDFEERFKRRPDYFITEKFAKDLDFPGLLIHDRSDSAAPYHYAEEVHAVWRNSNLITTFGLNHSLNDDRIVGFVLEFMEEKYLQAIESFNNEKNLIQ